MSLIEGLKKKKNTQPSVQTISEDTPKTDSSQQEQELEKITQEDLQLLREEIGLYRAKQNWELHLIQLLSEIKENLIGINNNLTGINTKIGQIGQLLDESASE